MRLKKYFKYQKSMSNMYEILQVRPRVSEPDSGVLSVKLWDPP